MSRLHKTLPLLAVMGCASSAAAAADIGLAIRSEAAFECAALATNGPDERRLLKEGVDTGRQFLADVSPANPDLGDVGQLQTTMWISVAHFEYRETQSADFALGVVHSLVSQRTDERVGELVAYYGREESDIQQEQFALKNCSLR